MLCSLLMAIYGAIRRLINLAGTGVFTETGFA